MKKIFDKFNIKLVPEGILICAEEGSRQNNAILQELYTILSELLDFAEFLKVKSRHLGSRERALDEEDMAERKMKYEAECDQLFALYSENLDGLGVKAARQLVKEAFNLRSGEVIFMLQEGRRRWKAKQAAKLKPRTVKPHTRRRDRLDPSLKKHKRKRAEKLFEQKLLAKAEELAARS